jgi:hypothetical protein
MGGVVFFREGSPSLSLPNAHKSHAEVAGDHILVAYSEAFRSCTMEHASVQYSRVKIGRGECQGELGPP